MTKPWTTTQRPLLYDDADKCIKGVDVEITVDWDKLARVLGRRAKKSKHGKAAMLGGAIRARIKA